jgi:hypothetical protein
MCYFWWSSRALVKSGPFFEKKGKMKVNPFTAVLVFLRSVASTPTTLKMKLVVNIVVISIILIYSADAGGM